MFRIFTRDNYPVQWAPTFASEAEAEAWIYEHPDEWDEAVKVVEFQED